MDLARGEPPPTGWLRALTGADEALSSKPTPDASPAARVTALLAAVTTRIGDAAPVTPDLVRSLTIGDRERLLLGLAAGTFGPDLDVVARCPAPDCGELIELSLSLGDFIRLPVAVAGAEHDLTIESRTGPRCVRVRLPRGSDQEEAAHLAKADPAAAARHLLSRCVLAITDQDGRTVSDDALADFAPALEDAIAAIDPAAEHISEAPCPACGGTIRAVLDGFSLLASGLAAADRLYAEVDTVARAYHWSEAEILSLPVARRRRYLDLIGAAS